MSTDPITITPILSPDLQHAIARFFAAHPPKKFSRGLRNMVVEMMNRQHEGHPLYVQDLLLSLEMFFDVLDQAEDEGYFDAE